MALIPFDDRDGLIWFDGALVPWRDARIHVINHGLHYASCVFEGERAYGGVIFKSKEHSLRLSRSAEILDLNLPWSVEQIEEAKKEVLEANNLTDAYVRPVVWRGSEQMGVSARSNKTHMAVACWEWPSYFSPDLREQGISLMTSRWRKSSPDSAPCHAKASGLYMIGMLSKHEAEAAGFTDALMLDYRGYAVEATAANLFCVKNGVVRTPKPDCFLNGITRQTVMELALELGYPLEEDHITVEELHAADEVFVTGTAAEVTAVGRIDQTIYTVGPVTRSLRGVYESLVRGKPIQAANSKAA